MAINPWIHDVAAYDYWSKPLGLLTIAAILRSAGQKVALIDCLSPYPEWICYTTQEQHFKLPKRKKDGHGKYFKEMLPAPDFFRSLKRRYSRYGMPIEVFKKILQGLKPPDIILVTSMMTYWYPGVFEAIELSKRCFPGVPVILGGIYATLCTEHAHLSGADYVISGPGEPQLQQIWKDALNSQLPHDICETDLDHAPYPALDLLEYLDQVPILTSRGCPYRCTYCASHVLYGTFLRRNPYRVADEIEYWLRHRGVRHFSFYDDALLVRPEDMIIPLLEEIVKRDLPVRFHCPNGLHLREMTPGIARLMYQAGFRTLRFGFETSNVKWQTRTGGKVSNPHLDAAIAYLLQAGYSGHDIGVYVLCGLPGQSSHDVHKTVEYVLAAGARTIITEYSPIPGTALWEEAVASSPYPLDKEPLCHNNSLLPCRSKWLTYDDYQKIKRNLFELTNHQAYDH